MRQIELTQGKFALVSDEDYDRVAAFKWGAHLSSRGTKWYARRRARKEEKARWGDHIRLHHFVLGIAPKELAPGHVVDHVNHDGLDCRRYIDGKIQLEIVTQEENMARSPGWKRAPEMAGCSIPGPEIDRSDEWN